MFAAGRILRQNRRLSSLPAGAPVPAGRDARPKDKRKFRCYLPFMWSALGMSFLGITIIVTGTAMCIAGWYLGHFADYETQPEVRGEVTSSNVSKDGHQSPTVEEITVSVLPARGLAYAGPVVMSFGCFAVVFACVVVCETRDRILETMESRVRRGLPARPPGGIDADFYALVVEFRKRRAEKQRRRRRLIQPTGDDDARLLPDSAATEVARPSTPLATSPCDLQTPSTINFFVDDYSPSADGADALDDSRPVPHYLSPNTLGTSGQLGTDTRQTDDSTPRWTLSPPAVPDYLRFTAADVELRPMDRLPVMTQSVSECVVIYSDCPPPPRKLPLCRTTDINSGCSLNSMSASDVEFSTEQLEPPTIAVSLTVPRQPHVDRRPSCGVSAGQFPLLQPLQSLADTVPYVRLEHCSQTMTAPPPQPPPTSFLHTASVHAIADRSPDVVVTSFEFPPPTATAATSGCAQNSGRGTSGNCADAEPGDTTSCDRAQTCETVDSSSDSTLRVISAEPPPPTDAACCPVKRRPPHSSDNTAPSSQLHVPSTTTDDQCLERSIATSSTTDDCVGGPSRKRSRASNGGADISPYHPPSQAPLLLCPGYLIAPQLGGGGTLDASAESVERRRRPTNSAVRQALTMRQRRRRPRDRPDVTSGRQSSRLDEPSCRLEEHQSADELDTLLAKGNGDDVSRLIWLRRRTSPTTSATSTVSSRTDVPDAFQSTV